MRAVRFERYGGPEVLQVVEVPKPVPGSGEVVVRAVAAAINPGELGIASGAMAQRYPNDFPEGEGSDLAGVIDAVGDGVVDVRPGDAVIGFSDGRNTHAEFVRLPADRIVPKPAAASWNEAASLYVAGTTAKAMLDIVRPVAGETVAVSGAAGGVGVIVVQLAKRAGARVIGIASESNHESLRRLGAEPVAYGDGLEDRIRTIAPDGVDGFFDTYGSGYVDLALALGVGTDRIDTIIDFAHAGELGVPAVGMSGLKDPRRAIADLAELLASGQLEIPVKAAFPLDAVQDAYRALSSRRGLGKIVLEIAAP